MMHRHTLGRTVAAALVWLLAPGAAGAAGQVDPDWPCIQRLVPGISAGTVWAGPPLEGLADWRRDDAVAPLAEKLAARKTPIAEAKPAIEAFAASLGADKDEKLSMLFVGILERIDASRGAMIEAVRRYARRQRALGERIAARATEIAALRRARDPAKADDMAALVGLHTWDVRIFEERERSLRYVCERPRMLEQRLFTLAREIMLHLD